MKQKKGEKEIAQEVKYIQQLHADFERQVKQRLAKLQSSQKVDLLQVQELRESEELFRTTFNHAAVGIAHVGLNGRWLRVNKRFCEIAGWSEKELLKQHFLETTYKEDHELDIQLINELMSGRLATITMEKRYVRKDGTLRWVNVTGSIVRDEAGEPKYGIGIVEDIHEKKQAEEMLKVLAKASDVLTSSLNYTETLASVANLLVPQFADWCTIDLLGEHNQWQRVKVAYANPGDKAIADKLYKFAPKLHEKNCFTDKAVRLRKSVLVQKVTKKTRAGCPSGAKELHKAVSSIKQKSFMVVPLIARDKVLGVITLRSTREYSPKYLTFVEQIASRIALAVDNARLYEKAKKAVQVRDEFLSIASHELKTSLTTVKALAQVLQRSYLQEQNKKSSTLLQKMDKQLNRTTKLINDLLDVSKIQSEKIVTRKELLNIHELLEEIVENCQRVANGHRIILKNNIHGKVYGDQLQISQVLMNVVMNAMKYSPEKKDIIISATGGKNNIIISVQDFGIGIEKERKEKIFQRFFRANTEIRKETSGLGLGLYISKNLVQKHNGSIWVESEVGKGSTFYISLPRVPVEGNKKQKN